MFLHPLGGAEHKTTSKFSKFIPCLFMQAVFGLSAFFSN